MSDGTCGKNRNGIGVNYFITADVFIRPDR